jgi:transcriptional regulator with XRE-family HTH domain
MTTKTTIDIVGANIRVLRKSTLTPETNRSINEFAKWTGVANGTVDRIEKGATDPQLSHLLKIAAKYQSYGLRIWHLFVPDLDPLFPPALISPKERDFYSDIERAYEKLQEPPMPPLHRPGESPKARGAVFNLRRKRPRK